MSIWPKISAADAALRKLLEEPQCSRLVEAIISKYLALTPAELEEWEVRHFRLITSLTQSSELEPSEPCVVILPSRVLHTPANKQHGYHAEHGNLCLPLPVEVFTPSADGARAVCEGSGR